MKLNFFILNFLFELSLIIIIKGDSCPENKISVSDTECESIENILEKENLIYEYSKLSYLSLNNNGKIYKNGYKLDIFKLNDADLRSHNIKKSHLYIPSSCLQEMENHDKIKLNPYYGIVIIVYNSNKLNNNNITNNYFIIRHNSPNSQIKYINSKYFDFSFCSKDPILFEDEINIKNLKYNKNDNTPIDINKIIYGKNKGIDLFNLTSPFFKDICFKFTSEKGTDVILESRVEDYYQNITFCDYKENSHYISYNYSLEDETFTYRCAFGYYKNEKDKISHLDEIENKINSYISISNIKVITCYKDVLSFKNLIKNYGAMICVFIFLFQIICFITFCRKGMKNIENQLDTLFQTGKMIIKRNSRLSLTIKKDQVINNPSILNNNNIPIKLFNLWGNVKLLKKSKTQNLQLNLNQNSSHKIIKDNEGNNNTKQIKIKAIINSDDDKNSASSKEDFNDASNKNLMKNNEKIYNSAEKNIGNNLTEGTDLSQLYEYENEELNELTFDKAIKLDKRCCCTYYGSILVTSHVILNVFGRPNDYNLFSVKLGLLFMTFPINLTFNIFFFTSKSIKLNYTKVMDNISTIWDNMQKAIYSSILSNFLLIILKFLCLTHDSIRSLRKIKDVNYAQKKSICILRCCKFRIFLFYILSFAFLIVFGSYVTCFCGVYENTQISLIKSTFISWGISLIYPFLLCIITSLFRSCSLKCKSSTLYCIKQFLQLF